MGMVRGRRRGGYQAAGADDSDAESSVDRPSGRQSRANPRASKVGGGGSGKRHSDDGDGFAADHPLGWGADRAPRFRPGDGDDDFAAQRSQAAQRASDVADAVDNFMRVAASVAGSATLRAPLAEDTHVVLHVPTRDPEAIRILGRLCADTGPEVPAPSLEDLDGSFAVVCSRAADASGRWRLEATRRGDVWRLAAPEWALLWLGAAVQVEGQTADGRLEEGVVAAEKPDRDTGLWRVQLSKVLSLLPANFHIPHHLAKVGAEPNDIHQGAIVEVRNLAAGKVYNGLLGMVLSKQPNEKGRWQVELVRMLHVEAKQLRRLGGPQGQRHGGGGASTEGAAAAAAAAAAAGAAAAAAAATATAAVAPDGLPRRARCAAPATARRWSSNCD
eukprot:TRINITY_DN61545_c0_g1_i1.p1 TRINITY_DN61545_c0_g1~~TRINITY_DN61545_c0_g1_i1.p1  ORF type:complete len:388 (-),score=95.60 TRINITY_DN61545_c0_g1_i1:273-1436(-)